MSRIIIDMSPSLDGYVAGTGVSNEHPFGHAGTRLHRWIGFEGVTPTDDDQEAARAMFATAGAVALGRRMFDVGIDKWGPDGAFERPCFVATHRPRAEVKKGSTTFTVVPNIADALARAQASAGEREIIIAGGADIAHQCLATGVVDELRLHVVPILLGSGTSLFPPGVEVDLEARDAVRTPNATHMIYRVLR